VKALAIMYHDVIEGGDCNASGFRSAGADLYKLGRDEFDRHLDAIAAAVPAGTVAVISPQQHAVTPEVFLTFDDGGVSAANPVAGLLETRGWRGHFFITTARIGEPGFLDSGQIRDLFLRGHAIGSHSHTHPSRMAALSRAAMDDEWCRSVGVLSEILRVDVKLASVPGGYYSRRVGESAAAAGVEALFTSEPTMDVGIGTGCLEIGRYVIQRGMGPEWSGGLAARRRWFRWRQTAWWNAKGVAKVLGGEAYLKVREGMLGK